MPINNAVSVDVEEYFQVSAFEPFIDRADWDALDSRAEDSMERILQLFDGADVQATFFVLGWIAERFPQLVRQIADLGHEVASHGYSHIRVNTQDRSAFLQDVDRTKKTLEDVTGNAVRGYRAASFSIDADNEWAYEVLASTGHRYSSSVYPIRHDRYGRRDASRFPAVVDRSGLVELPVSTVEIRGLRLPCGGGGYFRLLPYAWTKWAIGRFNELEDSPAIFYFHPWELDSDQPRVTGLDVRSRFRHYVNIGRMHRKLQQLLCDFRWTTIEHAYRDVLY